MKIGEKYHKLTVIDLLPGRKARCRCDCGREVEVWRNNISRKVPNTTSCGCVWKEFLTKRSESAYAKTPEFKSWGMMKNRCLNPNARNYDYYGGRGITICDRWMHSFPNFLEDMGKKPTKKHSLDRIDNNGNYCPENCKWSTPKEQVRNRRPNGTCNARPNV